jgi:hypothetical protein
MGYATDSPAHAAGELGVTRLAQSCGHVFCRKECVRCSHLPLNARADRCRVASRNGSARA